MKTFTEAQVIGKLRERFTPARGTTQVEVAKALGFTQPYISEVLSDKRPLSDALADSLGFRRVTHFVRKQAIRDSEA